MPLCSITTRPSIGCSGDAGVTPGSVATALICSQMLRGRHARPPLVLRFEHHVRFDHRGRSGVESRLDTADLAEHVFHFRNLLDQGILRLQDLHGLGEAGRRIQRRHVEPAAFVERNPVVRFQPGEDVLERAHSRARRFMSVPSFRANVSKGLRTAWKTEPRSEPQQHDQRRYTQKSPPCGARKSRNVGS